MANLYCDSCGGDIIPIETAYGSKYRCTACMYINIGIIIRNWRGECPICYEPHASHTVWHVCMKCGQYVCDNCDSEISRCPFCTGKNFMTLRTNNKLSADSVIHYERLSVHIHMTFGAFYEYLRWLGIKKTTQNVVPSVQINKIWATHLLDTASYRECCKDMFGTFIDSSPAILDTATRAQRLNNTHKEYLAHYDKIIDGHFDLWEFDPLVYKAACAANNRVVGIINFHIFDMVRVLLLKENMTAGELRSSISGEAHTNKLVMLGKSGNLADEHILYDGVDSTIDIYAFYQQ